MQGYELMAEGSLGQDSLEDLLISCSERSEDVFTLEKGQEQHYTEVVQVFFWDIPP